MKRLWWLLLLPLGLLVLSPAAHAACTTPELPVVGCPVPGPSESPSPTATPTPAPPPAPLPEPTAVPAPVDAVPSPVPTTSGGEVPAPVPTPAAEPVPKMPPAPVVVAPAPVAPATGVAAAPLSGVLSSSFTIVVFGLLTIPLLLGYLAGLRPAGRAPSPGGPAMRDRTRLWTGLGVLALAAVVGGVGWYRVSGEPLLNRQIPFLASAGIVVVLLSVLGGSLIIAEQLRGDQNRIADLENAVRALTEALAPSIESPPRVEQPPTEVLARPRGRSRRASAGST